MRYAEAFAQQYIADLNTALRAKTKYQSDKQQLCSELLLRLNKSLRNTVTQHTQYKEAKEKDDIIKLWHIVVECATGRGAHSVYVLMMRFINLKQRSNGQSSFSDYVRKYNETVTDLMRVGSNDPETVLRWLFNAKFVQGLNQDQFSDQIRSIMGKEKWPNYEELQGELLRYVTATKGIADTITKDNPDGTIIADAAKTTITRARFGGECFNCGKRNDHRARDCPKEPHKCDACGRVGHLEQYCRSRDEDKGDKPTQPDVGPSRSKESRFSNEPTLKYASK